MSTHDLVGIGIGPFNLGLAALAAPVPDLDAVFLDARDEFDWHPGLMLEGATVQVPFLADLVTMADPASPYSFLNYLKQTGRLYRFYIREDFHPLRAEYNAYCRWAADRIPGLRFGQRVTRVEHDTGRGGYLVHAHSPGTGTTHTYRARRLVLGIGTQPHVPAAARAVGERAVHSADYLANKARLQAGDSITVIGGGQSAAEIYLDLLQDIDAFAYQLDWVTRSPRFFPMEYTKLTLEMTSPEYISYFHALAPERRDRLIRSQRTLYKGISSDLVDTIFETLYRRSLHRQPPTRLLTCTELTDAAFDPAGGRFRLGLRQWEQDRRLELSSAGLVLATGYAPRVPHFLEPVGHRIRWDARGRFDVARGYTVDHDDEEIFVQNAEEHTHGLSAPDLGMGAYRNSVILNAVSGREVYPVEQRIAFQEFGVPGPVAAHPEPAGPGPVAGSEPALDLRPVEEVRA